MIKKFLSVIAVCILVISSGTAGIFAAEGTSAFSDTAGTDYETSAAYLAEKQILSGFPDGTFRPEATITRAEACAMMTRLLGASDEELAEAASTAAGSFSDVTAENWYASYIGYCVSKGMIVGYTDNTVRPSQQISLSEFATILCRAAGDSDESLGGTWPSNYLERAENRGLLKDIINCSADSDSANPLSRGNAAIMTYNYVFTEPYGGEDPDPDQDSDPDEDQDSDSNTESSDNLLDTFNGRAFGIITEVGSALNSSGNEVGSVTFLMGEKTYSLLTKTSCLEKALACEGTDALVYLQMSNGIIKDIVQVTPQTTAKDGEKYILTEAADPSDTARILFVEVKSRNGGFVRYYGADGEEKSFTILEGENIVYTCEPDGSDLKYNTGSLSDIDEGCYVIAYSIGEEADQLATVIIVIDGGDADEILESVEDDQSHAPRGFLS